jgi:hypothetical protein
MVFIDIPNVDEEGNIVEAPTKGNPVFGEHPEGTQVYPTYTPVINPNQTVPQPPPKPSRKQKQGKVPIPASPNTSVPIPGNQPTSAPVQTPASPQTQAPVTPQIQSQGPVTVPTWYGSKQVNPNQVNQPGVWSNIKNKWVGATNINSDAAAAIGHQLTGKPYKPIGIIQREKAEAESEYGRVNQDYLDERLRNKTISDRIDEYNEYYKEYHNLYNKGGKKTQDEIDRMNTLQSTMSAFDVNTLKQDKKNSDNKFDQLSKMLNAAESKRKSVYNDEVDYSLNLQVGMQKYAKDNSGATIARNFMGSMGKNAEGLVNNLVAPKVGMPDITSPTNADNVSKGLNSMFGGYRTNQGANEWAKTRIGDRGFVDAMVTVRPSRQITSFGAPGTIAGSDIQDRFSYSLPAKQIQLADVSPKQMYRIGLEDVRRNKKSKRVIVRRNISPAIVHKKPSVIVSRNLSLSNAVQSTGIKGLPMFNTIKKSNIRTHTGLMNISGLMTNNGLLKGNMKAFDASDILNNISKISKKTKLKKKLKVKV